MKTATHNNRTIEFNEDPHEYHIDGIPLKSATTFIKGFFPVFDSDLVAEKYALKNNLQKEEVLKGWKETSDKSIIRGNYAHKYLEKKFLGESTEDLKDREFNEKLNDLYEKLKPRFDEFELEKIIFSEKRNICGSVDFLGKSSKTGEYILLDWKTNKKIEKENPYGKFGFGPCRKIPDNNYHHYSLQLSFYKHILIEEGYIPREASIKMFIVHIPESSDVVFYEAKDFEKEIHRMLSFAGLHRVSETKDSAYDGLEHINIYSKGRTSLGRFLTNFENYPFNCEDGYFSSVEGYWYWLSADGSDQREELRNLSGNDAKKLGKKISTGKRLDQKEFARKISEAIKIKILKNPEMKQELMEKNLPLDHYYDFSGKIVKLDKYYWIVRAILNIRHDLIMSRLK